MSDTYTTDHEHDPSPEYLYPSDAEVIEIEGGEDGHLRVRVAVSCPECSETLTLSAPVDTVKESGIDLPLDDDYYD